MESGKERIDDTIAQSNIVLTDFDNGVDDIGERSQWSVQKSASSFAWCNLVGVDPLKNIRVDIFEEVQRHRGLEIGVALLRFCRTSASAEEPT